MQDGYFPLISSIYLHSLDNENKYSTKDSEQMIELIVKMQWLQQMKMGKMLFSFNKTLIFF